MTGCTVHYKITCSDTLPFSLLTDNDMEVTEEQLKEGE